MNCRRSEELLSDHLERALAPPLERELSIHLDGCEACRNLLAEMRDGLELMRTLEVHVPDPPEDLTSRILERTRPALAAARRQEPGGATVVRSSLPLPYGWVAAAAVLAVVLLWQPPELVANVGRRASLAVHQTYSMGVRMYYRAERWIDDLNVLRTTVAVAFEDRLDLLNERLRLLQKARRESEKEDSESSRVASPDESPV